MGSECPRGANSYPGLWRAPGWLPLRFAALREAARKLSRANGVRTGVHSGPQLGHAAGACEVVGVDEGTALGRYLDAVCRKGVCSRGRLTPRR